MHVGNRFGDVYQLSYATKDMDAAVAYAEEHLGITGFHVQDTGAPVLSGGRVQDLKIRAATANVGSRQFEIIQPVSGPTHVYTDVVDLDAQVMAFHHIAIAVRGGYDAWERLLTEVRASGDAFSFLFPAEPDPASKLCFCYVDTRAKLGHHTEYLWWADELHGVVKALPDIDA